MNHKRLAAALLTALALTTLPAMGTAFAEDGVDAYGRPDAAARTQQENPPVTVSITPSDTQEPSQRCLYLILSNDSRDFEHPCVQKQIGNCKRHNYPFMRKNIKKEIPRCIAKCKLHTLKESFLSFNLI